MTVHRRVFLQGDLSEGFPVKYCHSSLLTRHVSSTEMKSFREVSLLVFFIFVCLKCATSSPPKPINPLTWVDCGMDNRSIALNHFDISPKPLVLKYNSTVYIDGDLDIKEDIHSQTVLVHMKMYRVMMRSMRMPIFSESIDLCEMIEHPMFKDIICSIISATGAECSCPLRARKYIVKKVPTTVDISNLPIPKFLLRAGGGRYEFEARLKKSDLGDEVGCIRVRSPVKFDV